MGGLLTLTEDASKVIRNLSINNLKVVIKPGKSVSFPYKFVVDIEPREAARLVVFVSSYGQEDDPASETHLVAVDETIKIVYNDSIYDLQR